MTQVLNFRDALGSAQFGGVRLAKQPTEDSAQRGENRVVEKEAAHDFWPDVSCPSVSEGLPGVDAANAPGRVLFELFLVLAAAATAIVMVYLFVPNPPAF